MDTKLFRLTVDRENRMRVFNLPIDERIGAMPSIRAAHKATGWGRD